MFSNTMLLTTVVLIVASIPLGLGCLYLLDSYDWDLVGFIGCFLAGLMLLLGILIPALTYSERAFGRTECANWGLQTGRPTKFVIYTSWSTGECLTPDNNGHWISKDLVRTFK
jgi:hypothetical protein